MSETVSRESSSSLSLLLQEDGDTSARGRRASIVSLSSSLTDPDELPDVSLLSSHANTTTTTGVADGSVAKVKKTRKKRVPSSPAASSVAPTSDEEDDIVEVNGDGSDRPLTRIKQLLASPPKDHPKYRWETVVSTKRASHSESLTDTRSAYILLCIPIL